MNYGVHNWTFNTIFSGCGAKSSILGRVELTDLSAVKGWGTL